VRELISAYATIGLKGSGTHGDGATPGQWRFCAPMMDWDEKLGLARVTAGSRATGVH